MRVMFSLYLAVILGGTLGCVLIGLQAP